MAACFAAPSRSWKLAAMGSIAAHRSRRPGPRLFEGPVLFRRSRMSIVEFVALVWLVAKLAPLVRSYFREHGRGRARIREEEGN